MQHQLSLDLKTTMIDSLPPKPYATDDFQNGLKIQTKQKAITKKYLSLNHKYVTQWLTFDIDQPNAVSDFYDDAIGIPVPNIMVQNPANGHAHFLYMLQTPVIHYPNASIKPIQYLDAIYSEIRKGLNADRAYSGLISKNPLNDHWRAFETHQQAYSLGDLASHLDLPDRIVKRYEVEPEQAYSLGRNQTMFTTLRHWGYTAVREFRASTYQLWYESCLQRAMTLNSELVYPLPYSEIKSISKSVSKFCWRNDPRCYALFIERQSMLGLKRSAQYDTRRELAQQLHAQGVSKAEIARQLSVTDRTIRNWLNK